MQPCEHVTPTELAKVVKIARKYAKILEADFGVKFTWTAGEASVPLWLAEAELDRLNAEKRSLTTTTVLDMFQARYERTVLACDRSVSGIHSTEAFFADLLGPWLTAVEITPCYLALTITESFFCSV